MTGANPIAKMQETAKLQEPGKTEEVLGAAETLMHIAAEASSTVKMLQFNQNCTFLKMPVSSLPNEKRNTNNSAERDRYHGGEKHHTICRQSSKVSQAQVSNA